MDLLDIKKVIDQQGDAFDQFKSQHEERLNAIEQFMLKAQRPGASYSFGTGPGESAEDRKALDLAVRALVAGDVQQAYRHFGEAKAMSVGSDPNGGYLVHPVMSTGMTKVMAEISPVYRLARKVPMLVGDELEEVVDADAADAAWVTETQARGDTDTPEVRKFVCKLAEIYAQPKLTQKQIDVTGINVVAWLNGKVGEAFAVKEGVAFHSGDGIGKPRGFLSYPTAATADASRAWGTIQHIATGASGAFPTSSTTVNPADVLVDVTTAMKAQYRAGAVWLMNRLVAGAVRKLKDAEGRHVWVDSLVQGQPAMLLGYPVEIDDDMPDLGAGSLSIAFANLEKAFTIIEQPGIKFLADPYTDKPNVRLFNYRRVGGGMNNSEAIKLLKFS